MISTLIVFLLGNDCLPTPMVTAMVKARMPCRYEAFKHKFCKVDNVQGGHVEFGEEFEGNFEGSPQP